MSNPIGEDSQGKRGGPIQESPFLIFHSVEEFVMDAIDYGRPFRKKGYRRLKIPDAFV
jgi:hypothetical protein